jgi:hypothetical protein
MKDIVIQNNKYVKMQFQNIYVCADCIRGDIYTELHSFYNPFESMLFRFLYRDACFCNINNVAYNSLYTMCRRFYESSLKQIDMWRKAGEYKERLSRFLVNDKKVDIISPIKICAVYETKY